MSNKSKALVSALAPLADEINEAGNYDVQWETVYDAYVDLKNDDKEKSNRNDSLTDLWNDRLLLSVRIEDLLKPFCAKYMLRYDQIQLTLTHAGISIKVIV